MCLKTPARVVCVACHIGITFHLSPVTNQLFGFQQRNLLFSVLDIASITASLEKSGSSWSLCISNLLSGKS